MTDAFLRGFIRGIEKCADAAPPPPAKKSWLKKSLKRQWKGAKKTADVIGTSAKIGVPAAGIALIGTAANAATSKAND